jgi:alpha-tubulin suppressor-like RCC1 family protein
MRPPRHPSWLGAALAAVSACANESSTTVVEKPDAAEAPPPTCEGLGRSRCVARVSMGARFGCAALRDQTVWCWGRNDESQLGYESADLCPERLAGGQTRAVACHMYPQAVVGLEHADAVTAGGSHACARLTSGELRCWGGNSRGQLGTGSTLPSRSPVAVAGLRAVVSAAAGVGHTCAVVEDGAVFCWGANDRGQLGVTVVANECAVGGAMIPCARTPVRVPEVTDAAEVVVGDAHTCVRTRDGLVQCWGANDDGQLGAGSAGGAPVPRPQGVLLGASLLRGVRAIAAGSQHTCALRDNGAALCWGRHDRGQLGVPVPESFAPCAHACIPTAVPIVGYEGPPVPPEPDGGDASVPTDGARVDASGDASAPRDGGSRRDAGNLRDGAADAGDGYEDVPVDVQIVIDGGPDAAVQAPAAVAISAGGAFSCLSLSDQTVRCWGSNRAYELGNGLANEGGAALTTVIASPGSAATNPLQGAVDVESGGATTCAVLTDRSVRCWGTNEGGALGVGDQTERNGPVSVTW